MKEGKLVINDSSITEITNPKCLKINRYTNGSRKLVKYAASIFSNVELNNKLQTIARCY